MSPMGSTSPNMRRAVAPEVGGVMIAAFHPEWLLSSLLRTARPRSDTSADISQLAEGPLSFRAQEPRFRRPVSTKALGRGRAQRSKRRPDLPREQLGLFPGCEVTAS